ncbi:MAG: hypothetical protein WA814_12675 [Candidatus Baltobacteraceae bacterium]
MRIISAAALAAGTLALLAGCTGGAKNATSTLPSAGTAQSNLRALGGIVLPSGVDTRYGGPARVLSQLAKPAKAKVEKDLFVSDFGGEVIALKNKTYQEVGTITQGLSDADGLWTDSKGNLYVANATGPNVLEYKAGAGSPTCTYSSGLVDPINVTTDSAGNVYVADFNDLQTPGYVDEFPQCSNTVSKKFSVDSGPEGIAVDKQGNLFVSYFGQNGGNFEEFKGGSSTPTALGAFVGSPGGLVLDKHGNLIADDQEGTIDVIAPPYGSATVLVSGLSGPFHCSLNKKEALLFNANAAAGTVTVYKYPSGSLVTTLGSGNGITGAAGVSDSPNAVF